MLLLSAMRGIRLPSVTEQNFAVARSAAHQERQGPLWYLKASTLVTINVVHATAYKRSGREIANTRVVSEEFHHAGLTFKIKRNVGPV